MKFTEVPDEEAIDGKLVYNTGSNMADADPFVYGRLLKAGKTEEAKAMLNEKGFNILGDDGEYLQILITDNCYSKENNATGVNEITERH